MDQNLQNKDVDKVLSSLQDRVKELNCIYQVEELLQDYDADPKTVFEGLVAVIPSGWAYSEVCEASITYLGAEYKTPGFVKNVWIQSAKIYAKREVVGTLDVCYTVQQPQEDEGPFSKEERKLIESLADSIGHYIMHQELKRMVRDIKTAQTRQVDGEGKSASVITELLFRTDYELSIRVARKMLNHLYRSGVKEAISLFKQSGLEQPANQPAESTGSNIPTRVRARIDSLEIAKHTFEIAAKAMSDKEIITRVRRWMQEDKVSFLIKVLNDSTASIEDIADKLRRFQHLTEREHLEVPETLQRAICVHLIRRLMSGNVGFIKIAKDFVEVQDFYDLFPMMIYPTNSHGKLGGKGSGLFMASQVIRREIKDQELFKNVKIPKTYYLTTDGLYTYADHNSLEEIFEQKYKDIGQIRLEYPQIIELLKNGEFPPEIVQKLSFALDDLGDSPLIVRSSSLLEDQLGSAFAGKYQSLFLGNQGGKQERLEALMDAIAEVFASTFSPDPMEYRAERDLLDAQEEMGVLIEEVVGTKIGPYYMPLFAGVAFCNNEFRWSPRIKRDDGLVRLVPGLGTRAVDRVADDYPIMISPGQPGLRVNVTEEEMIRYSPNKIDVINLEKNTFETIDVKDFVCQYGDQLEGIYQIVSMLQDGHLKEPSFLDTEFKDCQPVVTFNGLVKNTQFIKQIHEILKLLKAKFGYAVDIEFASDGKTFYLLQCRPQSYGRNTRPAPIPKDIPENSVVFSANRYVSNGHVPDITHLVYVDPVQYSEISDKKRLLEVGHAISKLNATLPKRQFVLMGPGRWGSRGDIKLGVSVTYSDINNTAVLIEVARKSGNYVPDLSFGTHFFQDLVESEIRYLPLYPDDEGIQFNEWFLQTSRNILAAILPEYEYLSDVIKVIDIAQNAEGRVLQIFMNADLDEAVGILAPPSRKADEEKEEREYALEPESDEHWRWRLRMAESIARRLDPEKFGVKAFYVFGSTKNGTAGLCSDIDLLVHFIGDDEQKKQLNEWLKGWSLCLDEMNYLRTGYRGTGLLDVHLITDDDIARRTSYAVKIGAITDAAVEIPMGKEAAK
ncbi:MAG: nucleotidyltransferase domain-containing protein [bacterium]|nr:nucleotidyltransferase domain-containing protein [bacterium]